MYLFDELLREGAGGAKGLDLESHSLLGLGVKGGVLDEAVDKHPQVALDVEGLQVHASLVLLLGSLQQLGHQLVHYVVDVGTSLQLVCVCVCVCSCLCENHLCFSTKRLIKVVCMCCSGKNHG